MLRIHLLGAAHIYNDTVPLQIRGAKPLALLAYLLLTGTAHSRQHLAELFADGPGDPQASLRWTLTHLRRGIGAEYIRSDRKQIAFNTDLPHWVDVHAFEAGQIDLYQGDLLQGLHVRAAPAFMDWLLFQREHYRTRYQEGLEQQLTQAIDRADYTTAITTTQQLLQLDNLREDWYRTLMAAYAQLGQRTAALALFDRCQEVLQAELNTEPSVETVAIAAAIRHGERPFVVDANATSKVTPVGLPEGNGNHQPRTGFVSLVGRSVELSALRQTWEVVTSGHGQVVMIAGDPGIGKSRLIDEFLTEIQEQAVLLQVKCPDLRDPLAYTLVVNPLRELLAMPHSSELPRPWLSEISHLLPELHEHYPNLPVLQTQDPSLARRRLFDTVRMTLLSVTPDRPLVLACDDLQWADAPSLDVLLHLSEQLADRPVLILGAYRRHELVAEHPLLHALQAWRHMDLLTEVTINGLTSADVHTLLHELTALPDESTNFGELINRETGGNPLFILETIATLREAGRLPATVAPWNHDLNLDTMPLPTRIYDVIATRIKRLDERSQQIIGTAAVIGDSITLAMLQQASGCSAQEILDGAEQLLLSGLLIEQRETLRFSHDKIREVAYNELSQWRRNVLHQQVAEAIIRHTDSSSITEQAALLAYHYSQAGDRTQAARYHVQAGHSAWVRYAHELALTHYHKALASIPAEDAARKVEIYAGLGMIYRWQAQFTAANEAYTAMHKAAIMTGNALEQVRALNQLTQIQSMQGTYHLALDYALMAVDQARSIGPSAQIELIRALLNQGWCLVNLGQAAAALEFLEEGKTLSRSVNAWEELGSSLNRLAVANAHLGHMAAAQEAFEEAVLVFREQRNHKWIATTLGNLGELARLRGDYQAAVPLLEEAVMLMRELGHRSHEMLYLQNLAGARVAIGDYDVAESELQHVIQLVGPGETHEALAETYAFLAEALLGQDRILAALTAAEQALALAQAKDSQFDLGTAWYVLGLVTMRMAENTRKYQPTTCFAESTRNYEAVNAWHQCARTRVAWARYELRHGNDKQGWKLWQEARALFLENELTLEVERMDYETTLLVKYSSRLFEKQ